MNQNNDISADEPQMSEKNQEKRPLYELIVIMLPMVCIGIIIQEIKGILELIPLIYYFVEKRQRRRSWIELGVKRKDFIQDIRNNWYWFILIVFIIQISIFWAADAYWPAYTEHILSRITFLGISPYPDIVGIVRVLGMLFIFTLSEEIIYRGLTQERLDWYYSNYYALVITAVLFATVHYYPGDALVVFIDLLLVFVDSLIYGIIYMKSRNIFVSWTAHFAADIVGITMLLLII